MFAVGPEPLHVGPLVESVQTSECGALATFVGIVRATSDDGRAVRGLHYEAYVPLAIVEMEAIAEEARARFDGARVSIAHRIGELEIGETSVAIAVASRHRADAFDACEYAIDELKKRVPVWKRERYVDGDALWRENARDERP